MLLLLQGLWPGPVGNRGEGLVSTLFSSGAPSASPRTRATWWTCTEASGGWWMCTFTKEGLTEASWLERGSVKVDCFKEPSSGVLWRGPLSGGSGSSLGAGKWQNFPVELAGHQHSSLPMQRPPFRQGIWQK